MYDHDNIAIYKVEDNDIEFAKECGLKEFPLKEHWHKPVLVWKKPDINLAKEPEPINKVEDNKTNAKSVNLGTRRIRSLPQAKFPNADSIVYDGLLSAQRSPDSVDILLVNPPTPDRGLWIRTQHRVGRRTRENMVWPQVSLAQMAALLHPTYKVKIIDANAERMSWKEFSTLLDKYQP